MDELRPCPFCQKPLFIREGVNPYGRCETEGCWMNERKATVPLDAKAQVQQWNDRIPDADTIAQIVAWLEELEDKWQKKKQAKLEAKGLGPIFRTVSYKRIASAIERREFLAAKGDG